MNFLLYEKERCRICEKLFKRMEFVEHILKCKQFTMIHHKIMNISDQLISKIKIFEQLRRIMKLNLMKNLSMLYKNKAGGR